MSKPALLFLVHRIPFPPNKGDKIRSFNLLKALSKDYRIYLGAFVDDEHDWQYQDVLKDYCEDVYLRGLSKYRRYTSLKGLIAGQPLTLPYYKDDLMASWVNETLDRQQLSRIFIFSSAMAQYVQGDQYKALHRVIDFVDVDSEKWRDYSARRFGPMKWIYRREADCLLSYDETVANEFDASIFVSKHEADLFKKLAPSASEDVTFLNNGVDADYFSPAVTSPSPYQDDERVVVFTGAMDYWANADAVTWFAKKIFPIVQAKVPNVRFFIVGARPSDAVRNLATNPQIVVTGAVEDIRPYIKHAALSVAPMRIARGIQNKVLEAMAMAKPVIATTAAMEGIEPLVNQPLCNDEMDFAQQCAGVLLSGDRHRLGEAGRNRVLAAFNWEANLLQLEQLLGDRQVAAEAVLEQTEPELKIATNDGNGVTV